MLGKLIKYDIRSTWRDFAAAYACILLGVLVLPQIFKHIVNEIIHVVAVFLAIGIVTATIVVMIIMLFRIYNTNVFSKEGYLLMTLPVTPTQIVGSKLIVSSMWIVLTGIVAVIGMVVFLMGMGVLSGEVFDAIENFLSIIGGNGKLAVFLLALSMLFSIVKEIAKLFLACSISRLKQLGRLRIFIGIVSYFIFSWLEVVLVQVLMSIISWIPNTEQFIMRMNQLDQLSNFGGIHPFLDVLNGVMGAGILYSLVLVVGYGLGNIWILNRKLDLD